MPRLADVLRDLGRTTAELRVERGWTQAQLAEKLQWSLRQLQRIEAGERDTMLGRVVELARALGVQMSDMLAPPKVRQRPKRGRPPTLKP
jgi:transcriptional regulator with XRE-family HTH domain